jgi:hypothetical protein
MKQELGIGGRADICEPLENIGDFDGQVFWHALR